MYLLLFLFGCRYLAALDDGAAHQLLHKAIERAMVGRCFGLTFFIPPAYKHTTSVLTLSTIVSLNARLKRDIKAVELIAMEIKVLGGGPNTVLSMLHLWLEGPDEPAPLPTVNARLTTPPSEHALSSHEDSNFFHEHASGASPSQDPSLLLETFTDSPQPSSNLPLTLPTQCQVPPAAISTLSTSSSEHQSSCPPLTGLKQPSVLAHSLHTGTDRNISEYISELTQNESLLKELELDWEATQCNCPSPSPSAYQHTSFTEEMLRELQEPFSQSREPSPSSATPHSLSMMKHVFSDSNVTPNSLSGESTPELFSSASSSSQLKKPHVSVRPTPLHSDTPSQLLFDSRSSFSPELFGSSSGQLNTEHRAATDSQPSLQTPVMAARPQLPRRKLVQGTGTNISMLALTYQSPCEPHQHNTESIAHSNTFSPDIL